MAPRMSSFLQNANNGDCLGHAEQNERRKHSSISVEWRKSAFTSYRSCRCIESQFYDLEIMSRERVAAGRNEIDYWLIEAEEWGGFDALATCNGRRRQLLRGPAARAHQGWLAPATPSGVRSMDCRRSMLIAIGHLTDEHPAAR